jgi:hypothetical protein
MGLVPADQLTGMQVSRSGGDLQRAGDDRTAAFQRGAQGVQLLPREPQLPADVVDAGGPGLNKMIKQPPPAGIGRAHAGDLGPANGIQQVGQLTRNEQVLAPVHGRDEIAALGQFAEPRPLGRGPRGKTWAARLVRVLVTGPIQARQRAIGGAGQQPAIAQELLRLSERAQRPVRSQPAVERPADAQAAGVSPLRGRPWPGCPSGRAARARRRSRRPGSRPRPWW